MSAICERFIQNAWKKDLCSNCFKSKEEHLNLQQNLKPLPLPSLTAEPPKGIMKTLKKGKHKRKVSFPKDLSEVIGFGGEWSESDGSDVELDIPSPIIDEHHSDENEHELQKITKSNTDFNTENGNLLGEPEPKIKKSFAALKLGNSQKDKQPLQISVMPFGTSTSKVNDIKQMFVTQKKNENKKTNVFVKTLTTKSEAANAAVSNTNKNIPISPDIDIKITEKTLLEEISETLEMNKNTQQETINLLNNEKTTIPTSSTPVKLEISNPILIKTSIDTKRTITRHIPIKKDQIKPKITVFTKTSSESSDGNFSDQENCSSAYYDVVESSNSYENVPDGFELNKAVTDCNKSLNLEQNKIKEVTNVKMDVLPELPATKKTKSFFSSQLISDMFLSKKPINDHLRKRSEVYNLSDRSYITSKITSDGLIVTKNSNEDVLDSSGSSFDSSSDEEMSSMNRSESDSGIGICVSNEYQNIDQENRIKEFNGYDICENGTIIKTPVKQTRSVTSTNSSDYEDIQVVTEQETTANIKTDKIFSAEKSRKLAGEPDGRSDPDGSAEAAPALPSCPPPTVDARKSFLHGLQTKPIEKPKVPTKPTVSVIKTFAKRGQNVAQQQVIMQLQQVMKPATVESVNEPVSLVKQDSCNELNKLTNKKGRAPNPPPSPTDSKETDDFKNHNNDEFEMDTSQNISEQDFEKEENNDTFDEIDNTRTEFCKSEINFNCQKVIDESSSSIYTRNPLTTIKSNSPVVREKDKRERAIINPKFRSLNTFSSNRSTNSEKSRALTPEPAPRKSLSISQDSLNVDSDKKKKNKFSIKKFLRMGSNKNVENVYKKEGIYSDIQSSSDDQMIEHMPQIKPRLVIIHPLDINNTGVEVVKDIRRSSVDLPNYSVTNMTVTGKPPAPPIRSGVEGHRIHDLNKPARPPPPKSAELRRKQKMGFIGTEKNIPEPPKNITKPDNVYANLGEVRSAIAPRKPERTASMREKDGQLELPRRRPVGQYESVETESDISSNATLKELDFVSNISRTISDASEDSIEAKRNIYLNHDNQLIINEQKLNDIEQKSIISSSTNSYNDSFNERKKKIMEFENNKLIMNNNKTELYEQTKQSTLSSISSSSDYAKVSKGFLNDGIKNSVQKMTNTIDSYLKDKLTSSSSSSSSTTTTTTLTDTNIYDAQYNNYVNKSIKLSSNVMNSRTSDIELRTNGYESVQQQRSSLPMEQNNNSGSIYGGSISERSNGGGYRRIEQNDYNKKYAVGNLPRATSMSYCGSEMGESEIYSPYSFYGSEAGTDVALGDVDGWGSHHSTKTRSGKTINRLRMRKGRSVVHKNLEDNYGAVVVANHEALAQVLEQLQQTTTVPMALRPISNTINLRFEDFTVLESARGVVVGRRAFHTAIWANHTHVTLALTADCNQISGVGGDLNQLSGGASGALNPITEFCDLVPSHYLPLMPSTQIRLVQATISVLPRMHVDTIQSLGSILKTKSQAIQNGTFGGSIPNLSILKDQKGFIRNGHSVQNLSTLNEANNETIDNTIAQNPYINSDEILYREVGFVMLQLVNGLKNLQATGIEEMPLSLSNVILCKEVENKEAQARLCVFQGFNQDSREEEEPMGTLCQCAHTALTTMLPTTKLTTVLSKILLQERSESLSKIKSILEFSIWGPSDVILTGPIKEREMSLQRWLDLERATVLHGLVRTRIELTVYDECHLMFLVRSNAKIMCEASSIMLTNNCNNNDIAE